MNDYQECSECGELEAHNLHHDVANPMTGADVHFDICNVDVDYQGDPLKPVISVDCHEYEPGCYCADSGRCEVCVESAVMQAEYMNDAAKEG